MSTLRHNDQDWRVIFAQIKQRSIACRVPRRAVGMYACIHDRPYHVRNACMDIEDRHEHKVGKFAAHRRPQPPGFCGLYHHKGARRPRTDGTEGPQQMSILGVLCLYIAIQVLNGALCFVLRFGMNWHSGWRTAAFGGVDT